MKIYILAKIIVENYYNLKLEEESKKLTAFTVPQGFYEWNVLPFGYKNAPGRYVLHRRIYMCI